VELRAEMDGWMSGLAARRTSLGGGLLKCLDNRVEALIFELMLDLGAQLLRAPYIGCWVLMRAGN